MAHKRLQVTTPASVVRKARSLAEWIRLARRSPAAVPPRVQRTIQQRYPAIATEVGYA